jgi:hypothetical protein
LTATTGEEIASAVEETVNVLEHPVETRKP